MMEQVIAGTEHLSENARCCLSQSTLDWPKTNDIDINVLYFEFHEISFGFVKISVEGVLEAQVA
jgi:hypothetical protein